jgi:hypothetical protein
VTTITLVQKHKSWTKTERRQLAGQVAELTDETDHAGKRLAVLRSGPLLGCGVWLGMDEIAEDQDRFNRDSPDKTIDVSSAEGVN